MSPNSIGASGLSQLMDLGWAWESSGKCFACVAIFAPNDFTLRVLVVLKFFTKYHFLIYKQKYNYMTYEIFHSYFTVLRLCSSIYIIKTYQDFSNVSA